MPSIHYRESAIWGPTPYDVWAEELMAKLGIYSKILEAINIDESRLNDGLSPSKVNSALLINNIPNNPQLAAKFILKALGFNC